MRFDRAGCPAQEAICRNRRATVNQEQHLTLIFSNQSCVCSSHQSENKSVLEYSGPERLDGSGARFVFPIDLRWKEDWQ